MNRETFALSQKALQRVAVISRCVKGELACARAAGLLCNVVQWEGRRFQIPQQARRFSFAGAKVHIYQALGGRGSLYYRQTRLQHSAISGGDSFMLPLG